MVKKVIPQKNVTFSGCGFLGLYHVGVGACMKQYAPYLLQHHLSGASAGASVAACLLCDASLGEITRDVLKIVYEARTKPLGPFSSSFHLSRLLKEGLQKVLPEDAHKRVNGKLHVSLTRLHDQKNVIVSRFTSKEDLIQALLASAFIPLFSGYMPPRFHGTRYVDGALSNNLPVFSDNTITVSPLCGKSDICPDDSSPNMYHFNFSNDYVEISFRNLFRMVNVFTPREPAALLELCNQGFQDALKYLRANDLITCESCSENSFPFSKPEEIMEANFDPQCPKCLAHKKQTNGATLPDNVTRTFEDAIDVANASLTHIIFKYNSVKILLFLGYPYTMSVDMLIAFSRRCLESPIIKGQNLKQFIRMLRSRLYQILIQIYREKGEPLVYSIRHKLFTQNRVSMKLGHLITKLEKRSQKLITFAANQVNSLNSTVDSDDFLFSKVPKVLNSVPALEYSTDKLDYCPDKIENSTDKLKNFTDKIQESADKIEKSADKLEYPTDKIEYPTDKLEYSTDKLNYYANQLEDPNPTDKINKLFQESKNLIVEEKQIKPKTTSKVLDEDSRPECDQRALLQQKSAQLLY